MVNERRRRAISLSGASNPASKPHRKEASYLKAIAIARSTPFAVARRGRPIGHATSGKSRLGNIVIVP
jgi:hypothetical protein